MRLFLLCICLGFGLKATFAQDSVATQMNWHRLAKSSSNLFVHFDKNIYANNETIWFTGYLIKQSSITFNKHQVLAVSLVRDVDSTIVIQDKFLIQDGMSFGSLVIPDSLLTGDYHLMSHTDLIVNGKPDALFLQPITIKTNIEPSFKASMKIISAANIKVNTNQVLLSITSKEGSFLPKPTTISYKYGGILKNAKTDASGQLLMSLPIQPNLTDPNLYVKLNYQKDSSFINMPLPLLQQKASVMFYPEGGNMINGLQTMIGWEVKDQQKMPLATLAFLYKNDQIIDTIETGSYGLGKFKLTPQRNAIYTIKLQHSALTDSIYSLPKILPEGLSITVENAVVVDTLRLNLKSHLPRQVILRIHNFKESYLTIPFDMEYPVRAIKIPLNDVPKGLTTLTICDTLDRPLAERMFFAHYDAKEKISLLTDQKTYKKREKVNLKLKLLGAEENAIVSIACIQDNRMELKKMTDIESYTFLTSELNQLPVHLNGKAFKDKAYLEQILMIKGWRKYNWQDVGLAETHTSPPQLDSLRVRGQVWRGNKKLVKEVELGTMGPLKMSLITTSASGTFELGHEHQLAEVGKKLYLFVNEKNKNPYKIQVEDGYEVALKKIARSLPIQPIILPSTLSNNETLVLKSNEKEIRLKEVVIKKNNDNSFSSVKAFGRNECGDYVCMYNILNCRNHSDGTHPVVGKTYANGAGGVTVYKGCVSLTSEEKSTFFPFSGIHLSKEFYINDYKDPQEPAFFSTIYWNFGTFIGINKETELNFFTSDITGRFRIVVQGLTNKDVVYAEQFFEVKK